MKPFLASLVIAFLIGLSVACALLVLILISMLERYSKDIQEVVMTWQYITAFTVVGCIALGAVAQIKVSLT